MRKFEYVVEVGFPAINIVIAVFDQFETARYTMRQVGSLLSMPNVKSGANGVRVVKRQLTYNNGGWVVDFGIVEDDIVVKEYEGV